jgi:hypothetical protein
VQHHGSKEANIDISRELEDVFILPIDISDKQLEQERTVIPRSSPSFSLLAEALPRSVFHLFIDHQQILGDGIVVS